MIRILFPLFFILLNIQALGQSEVIYPAENPLYSIIVPKGWTAVEYRDYKVLEIYNKNESIIYSIYELGTPLLFEAVKRADTEAETEFINYKYGTAVDEDINGITFHTFSGTGATEDDEIFFIKVKLFQLNNNFYMIYYSAPEEEIDYFQIELDAINNSIKKY